VSHVTDGEDVANDAVTVAVDVGCMGLDVLDDHLALELAALLGVKADVVGVIVPLERGHIQLTGGRVRRLAVVENDRLRGVRASGGGGRTAIATGATAAHEGAGSSDAHHAEAASLKELTTRKCHEEFRFLSASLNAL